jgi:membrane-associated protease RseP (regulator of RpoE activity)
MATPSGQEPAFLEVTEALPHEPDAGWVPARRPGQQRPFLAIGLFLATVLSTLAVGAQFALTYSEGRAPISDDWSPLTPILAVWRQPQVLWLGIPFSLTLLTILLAHELGHFFACRHYKIQASYPYFIPAPTIIGTMGAFIRIRSSFASRQALFDVGLAGPVVGFLFAVPALVVGILHAKVAPGAEASAAIVFGNPPLVKILAAILRPGIRAGWLLLDPIGRAAWIGLFATAMNLLPAGQLDGGHIVYSITPERHRRISFAVAGLLLPLGYFWPGWIAWAVLLVVLGFRHPPLLNRWEPLDMKRRIWAGIGLIIFLLCFTPKPFTLP